MAQIPVRLNTQAMTFPLLSQLSGRTVIAPQGDLTYVPGVSPGEGAEVPQERGVPSIFYAHNVMPSTYGWQSIGYDEQIPVPSTSYIYYDIQLIQGAEIIDDEPESTSLRTYITKANTSGSDAILQALDRSTGEWKDISNSPTFDVNGEIYVAPINGFSYILIPGFGVYIYDVDTNTLEIRDLDGIVDTDLLGITSTNGYLIVWTDTRILWSSVVNPEDFVPSEVSGAGGGGVQDAAGPIIACMPTSLGLIIFTDTNAVSVVYSGNENFPFNFKQIPSVGGIYNRKLVSEDTANGYHYAYTTNGIQRITHNQSSTLLTYITDFIDGNVFEDYDEVTSTLATESVTESMNRRLALIANRYLCISYAKDPSGYYTHAIVVDLGQGRVGKLKYTHTKLFEYRSIFSGTNFDSRSSLAVLDPTGIVKTVSFDLNSTAVNGIMILGKLQYIRQRYLQLQEIEVENVQAAPNFDLEVLPSLDGKNFESPVSGYLNSADSGNLNTSFLFSHVALNHSIVFKRAFNVISLVATVNVHGKL